MITAIGRRARHAHILLNGFQWFRSRSSSSRMFGVASLQRPHRCVAATAWRLVGGGGGGRSPGTATTKSQMFFRGLTTTTTTTTLSSDLNPEGGKAEKSVVIKFTPPTTEPIEITCNSLARLADGSALATQGGTSVLVTMVSKGRSGPATGTDQGFVPLTVDYRQRAAAAGRIPTNYFRREVGQSEREILVGRMIDRSIRPLFTVGFSRDTQLICTLLSMDSVHDPEILAINGASAALATSAATAPHWRGPTGTVRVALMPNEEIVVNPTRRQQETSIGSLMLTSRGRSRSKDKNVLMLDGGGTGTVTSSGLLMARLNQMIVTGIRESKAVIEGIQTLSEAILGGLSPSDGDDHHHHQEPQKESSHRNEAELRETIYSIAQNNLLSIFTNAQHDKMSRDVATAALRERSVLQAKEAFKLADSDLPLLNDLFNSMVKEIHREMIFERNLRSDGRRPNQMRPLSGRVNLFRPLHGSALFQRGQTQVLCTAALDSQEAALRMDTMTSLITGLKEKNFMLHYEFPKFATGDLASVGGTRANRRELGHGALAERALRPVVPPDGFPFTTRLTCEVLESNGSSSMASVCAGSMALMDAGMPIVEPVAGVAIGLISRLAAKSDHCETSKSSGQSLRLDAHGESLSAEAADHDLLLLTDRNRLHVADNDYVILADLMGMEDYLGEMDLKIAGTSQGVTAIQLDCKLASGIPWSVLERSILIAHEARQRLIVFMNEIIPAARPREDKKEIWPVQEVLRVPPHRRSALIGPAGLNLKRIHLTTGVQISFDPLASDPNVFNVFAPNQAARDEAQEMIDHLLATAGREPDLEFGAIYTATIAEVRENGLMVTLYPNMTPTLLHLSQLDLRKVAHPSAIPGLEAGAEIQVKYFGRDPVSGTMRLSRKVLQTSAVPRMRNMMRDRTDSSSSSGGGGGGHNVPEAKSSEVPNK